MTDDRFVVLAPIVQVVAAPFFVDGHKRVYVATCCDRVLVTLEEPEMCSTCGSKPEGTWIDKNQL